MAKTEIVITQKEKKDNQTPVPGSDNQVQQKITENVKALAALKVADFAVNEITTQAAYEINKSFQLNDDYIGQRNVGIAISFVNKAANIAAGYAVGGPILGTVNAAIQVLSTIFDIGRAYDQQNIMLRQMDKSLEFNRVRAGFSLTSNSIGDSR